MFNQDDKVITYQSDQLCSFLPHTQFFILQHSDLHRISLTCLLAVYTKVQAFPTAKFLFSTASIVAETINQCSFAVAVRSFTS